MKKLVMFLSLIILAKTGYGQTTPAATAADVAVLTWDSQTHDFGKVKQGTPVTHEFKFTNKGKVPLVITNVQASCGCTTPSWSKDPVLPGQQGFIKATYNAASPGAFDKSVNVTANIETGTTSLKIKGEVTPQTQPAQ